MRNFLNSARDYMKLTEKESDAQVIAQLQRSLTKMYGK
jgi:hypothetical protein